MRDISALHPELQSKLRQLIDLTSREGITIGISECFRTVAEQDSLYAKGRTTPGNIVTNATGTTYNSQHQWGIAADFYLDMDVDGDGDKSDDAYNDSTQLFETVGAIAVSIGLGWGGNWKSFQDRPHVYLPQWGATPAALKAQYGTPDAFIASWSPVAQPEQAPTPEPVAAPVEAEYTRTQFIMDVQEATGSKVDGKAGNETIGNTITVSMTINQHDDVVTPLERMLKQLGYYTGAIEADNGKPPCFGKGMDAAVKAYQQAVVGMDEPDGEITKKCNTWKHLLGMM